MMKILAIISEANCISYIIRLVLATILGGIIGMERESKRHPAGFRTFTLVCIGATLATISNIYLFEMTGSTDTSRISAAVISGVGFLGVGTIIVTRKNMVRGLTTAAGLWATACLGVALGAGMIIESLVAFGLIMITMSVFSRFSNYMAYHNRYIILYIEILKGRDTEPLFKYLRKNDYTIVTMEKKKEKVSKETDFVINLEIDMKTKTPHADIIRDISELEGINYVEEVRS